MRNRIALIGGAVLLVGGAAVVLWYLGPRGRESSPRPLVATKPVVAAPQTCSPPTTFPAVRKWLSQHTYEDTRGRLISNWDIDEDGLYDHYEIVCYGTLRYNAHTRSQAPRINLPPPAKPKVNPNDTDNDGLHDAWEKGYFGTLKYGRWDDPDGDGYPNGVELSRRTSPAAIDLADPKLKPASFARGVPSFRRKRGFSTDSRECWAAQAAARAASRPSGD